jgi:SAM-dependent methyltransferase
LLGSAHVSASRISGWVADPDLDRAAPNLQVRLTLNGDVLREGVADLPRPDVERVRKAPGARGFNFPALALGPAEIRAVAVEARAGADAAWQPVKRAPLPARRALQYQSFDDARGASRSADKLRALRLATLANRHSEATPLKGLSVLDLGCNEGFFCGEALRQGARRVVGIDQNRAVLERARRRFPAAEFRAGSWWDVPAERFDVIFFLSALHYEPRQRALLQKLAGHLTPTGVLVVECGISSQPGKTWEAIRRADGVRRYPTLALFCEELAKPFAVRGAGPSVLQDGDVMPRRVFHCALRESMALLVAGPTNVGKTMLTRELGGRNVPVVSTDRLLGQMLRDKRYDWSPAAAVVRRFPPKPPVNFARIGAAVAAECAEEFVEVIMTEAPFEADLVCIEGEILQHAPVRDALMRRLRAQNVRPWLLTPEAAVD